MVNEQKLSEVLSDFARTMLTDFPIQGILDCLVGRIVEIMPVSAAGVSLISPDRDPYYVAGSDETAMKMQSALGEGPCIAAYETSSVVSIPDLRRSNEFPAFAKRALELGLVSVFSFPLRGNDRPLGALVLYGDSARTLDAETMAAAQTLADVTSAYILNAQSRADLRDAYDRVHQNSLHDPLTHLPNRVLFDQRLQHAVQRAQRSSKMAAVLFVDLDHFKAVNDTYGHRTGDELLIAVAERLSKLIRPGDSLARLSGDEFVILCEDLDAPSRVEGLAQRIGEGLAAQFVLPSVTLSITASIGIAFAGPGNHIPEQLLRDADEAMYQAKRRGKAHHEVLDIREQQVNARERALERGLHGALERNELQTRYEPIVHTDNGEVAGAEVFLEWRHPEMGSIPSLTVLALAERTDLICTLNEWALEQACEDRKRFFVNPSGTDPSLWIHISSRQLMSSGFVESIERVLTASETPAHLITLQINEFAFALDHERVTLILHDLKALGVRIALDDFGAGYSSLFHLSQAPIDAVKIDENVIATLPSDHRNEVIVAAVVDLAHDLGVEVVAEGVRTADQRDSLLAIHCEECQGRLFFGSTSAEGIQRFIETGVQPGSSDTKARSLATK